MEAKLQATTISAPASPRRRARVRFAHSLLFRVAIGSFGFIGIVTITLFLAIDHFVTGQFETFRAERVDQAWSQIESIIQREKVQLAGFARLLANDIELGNSAYYHLFLEGEQTHPQEAVDRIARAFDLGFAVLLEPNGNIVASSGHFRRGLLTAIYPAPMSVSAYLVHRDKEVWFTAAAPIRRAGDILVHLRIGRRFPQVIDRVFNMAGGVRVRVSDGVRPPQGAVRRELKLPDGQVLALDIRVPNTVAAVLEETKTILIYILGGFGLFLTAAIFSLLRWQLLPVRELTLAAAAVGRGDFDRSVTVKGTGEVAELSRAFNAMAGDLRNLRELERQLRHKEQLSAIGRVAARVAHDVNNPLTVIRNAAILMRREMDDGNPLADDLDRIVHHSNRSIAIVENLLHYGRPVVPRTSLLDLDRLCADIIQRWGGHGCGSPPVRLGSVGRRLPVWADPFQVEQLMVNLLDNARESNPSGPIRVKLDCRGSDAVIEIIDAGSGFSDEARRHLFEPFFTTKDGGTGLGLASALAIARAHKGDIEIGTGAHGRIIVRLPMDQGRSPLHHSITPSE
jgi:signal transduction histidine kinase